MNRFNLIFKSIIYYRKVNLASILTSALSVAIITGALIIGDSVKYSLQQITMQRLGKTDFVLNSGDKLFRKQLAQELTYELNTNTTPLLQLNGMASASMNQLAVNNVRINGIDASFHTFSPRNSTKKELLFDEIYINSKLAQQLQVSPSEYVLLKIRKHEDVPLNSPFIKEENRFVSLYVRVKDIINDDELGRFNLKNDQVSPYNVFVNIDQLNSLINQNQTANIILIADNGKLSIDILQDALRKTWKLADASLSIIDLNRNGQFEIHSDQIFINRQVIDAVNHSCGSSDLVLTYLVNGIKKDNNVTPYSFVTGMQFLKMDDNQIIINRWLADDLNASVNDTIKLSYYKVRPYRHLTEETEIFTVKEIVGFDGFANDASLMPSFPGLADVENCRDWDVGVNIDLKKIRNKDEKYWDDYRGTPKAFISYEAAKKMWENNFGKATAIRFSPVNGSIVPCSSGILKNLNPAEMGLHFIPIKQQGMNAANNAVDFSQLFLGMSFFIVIAALLLIAMFFHLNLEYRNKEIGIYMALGYEKRKITKYLLLEGMIIMIIGSFIGLAGAIGYNKFLLKAINTIWFDMVKTNILFVKVYPKSLFIGWLSGVLISFLTLYFSLKNTLKKSITGLQRNIEQIQKRIAFTRAHYKKIVFIAGIIIIVIFTIMYLFRLVSDTTLIFFIYGILSLTAGISGINLVLSKDSSNKDIQTMSFFRLCIGNIKRNKKRGLMIVSLLAIGVYLVISTGANRQYMIVSGDDPKSGTGGFLLFAQTTLPVIEDLNDPEKRVKYGLEEGSGFNLNILPFMTLDGDESSCFNLNRVENPQLLGVDFHKLSERNSFSFAKTHELADKKNPWSSLGIDLGENTYPVVADQTVIQWSFGKKIGDTLYFQTEDGDTANLVLVGGLKNSIFQGNLLISDSVFRKLYPSVPGSKVFLIDGNKEDKENIVNLFQRNFRDYGIELIPARERLVSFYSVQNTYLNVFIMLGGIGMIIGTLGIGILIFRAVLERKYELAILRAIGFKKTKILKILITENIILLLSGLLIGSISAIISTLPSFLSSGSNVPAMLIFYIMLILMVFGLIVVCISVLFSTKKNLVGILKSE